MTQPGNVITFPASVAATPLRRPRLMIQAARNGQRLWRRDRDLPKLLKCDDLPVAGRALPRLRAEEATLNSARLEGAAEYDMRRHVALMVAILAEMRASSEVAPPRARAVSA